MNRLPLGGGYSLQQAFLSEPEDWFERLETELNFEQRSIVLFGKQVMQPRLISWVGDRPYTYSGDTLGPRPWGPIARELLDLVNRELRHAATQAPPFNHLLANLYRDGQDSMGLHSDDEHELGKTPWIASVSLGQERRFHIAPKKKFRDRDGPAKKQILSLQSGSLLLMQPPMQRYYVHGLPKSKTCDGRRLNLTFRAILE